MKSKLLLFASICFLMMISIAYVVYPAKETLSHGESHQTIHTQGASDTWDKHEAYQTANSSETLRIIIEKNQSNSTFIVSFTDSALMSSADAFANGSLSNLIFPQELVQAINGSSRVIVVTGNGAIASSGSYGEILWWEATHFTIGGYTHYHLSAIDAINKDSALKANTVIVGALSAVLALATGPIGIAIGVVATFLQGILAANFDTIFSWDHNNDGSFDYWSDMIGYQAFYDFDYIYTPHYMWYCTLYGARITQPNSFGSVNGGTTAYTV